MKDRLRTIRELAEELGIPEPTARRWAKQLEDYLNPQKVGRTTQYPPVARDVLSQAKDLFKAGHTSDEVYRILGETHTRVLEGEPLDDEGTEETSLVVTGDDNLPADVAQALEALISRVIDKKLEGLATHDDIENFKREVRQELQQQTTMLHTAAKTSNLHDDEVVKKLEQVERLSQERVAQVDELLRLHREQASAAKDNSKWWQWWRRA